ncbi:ribonuclease H-like protein [Tothia fuscella]|uniref:ribonuclease H n=1 Tax=Tothia fuscella TaxID=1048955 RepID=A0A9P4TUR4_9PEZI|nr:ribonuclease H-like protein [Tothia fuscella]
MPTVDGTPNTNHIDLYTHPEELFAHNTHDYMVVKGKNTAKSPRFVRRCKPSQFLVYCDGACTNNGGQNARSGYGFVYGPDFAPGHPRGYSVPLETSVLDGSAEVPTNNRAEMWAVLAALRCKEWELEGFNNLVIASDSEYLVKGITEWIRDWARNGWYTSDGSYVKNVDLWKTILEEVNICKQHGLDVSFWHIPSREQYESRQPGKICYPAGDSFLNDAFYSRLDFDAWTGAHHQINTKSTRLLLRK